MIKINIFNHIFKTKKLVWSNGLNLQNENITDNGLEHLKGMPINKLYLWDTKITDNGLKYLKEIGIATIYL